jgi:putative transposase
MPRGRRLTFDDALFHITNRGNAQQEVFHEPVDFEEYLHLLARYKDKFGFKMYHFSLMPNHFHLLWKVPKAEILSKAMQGITLSYTLFHHAKYEKVGYLWQGRFKNMIIEMEEYLMNCGAYIERNPVRAGLVTDPGDWKWSSYRFYAFGEPLGVWIKIGGVKKWVSLIDENPFYQGFGLDSLERQKNYRQFVLGMDDEIMREKLRFQDGGVLGSERFKAGMARIMEELGMLVKPRKRGRPAQN